MRAFPTLTAVALALPALATLACGEPAPPPAPEPVRVEHAELALAIAALPEPFAATTTTGESLELTAPGPNGPGTVRITVGPPSNSGINLVEATKARQAEFEIAPGGKFYGTRSLGGALGNVFTARGGLLIEDGTEVEETWAFALHPIEKTRMMSIVYRYPPG